MTRSLTRVSGRSWRDTPVALSAGSHNVSFQIEDTSNLGVSVMKTSWSALHVVSTVAELNDHTITSVLSVSAAGPLDLTAVDGLQQPALHKITLKAMGIGGITAKLDSGDVSLGADARYSTGTVTTDGRHQRMIDGATGTRNTVDVADRTLNRTGGVV